MTPFKALVLVLSLADKHGPNLIFWKPKVECLAWNKHKAKDGRQRPFIYNCTQRLLMSQGGTRHHMETWDRPPRKHQLCHQLILHCSLVCTSEMWPTFITNHWGSGVTLLHMRQSIVGGCRGTLRFSLLWIQSIRGRQLFFLFFLGNKSTR